MEKERLENLLNELSERTAEPVPSDLAMNIKNKIPSDLARHKSRLDTIRIIIDLKVSRLAAAAVIIATVILCTSLFSGPDLNGKSIHMNSKLLFKYLLTPKYASSKKMLEALSTSPEFQEGREVFYYGDNVEQNDPNALLMHWKVSDNGYRVIYSDMRTELVSTEKLIKLQARMLQKSKK